MGIGQGSLLCRKKLRSRETEGVPGWFDSLGFLPVLGSYSPAGLFIAELSQAYLLPPSPLAPLSRYPCFIFLRQWRCVNRRVRSLQNRVHAGRFWDFLQRILARQGTDFIYGNVPFHLIENIAHTLGEAISDICRSVRVCEQQINA